MHKLSWLCCVEQAHEYGEAFELTSNNRVDLNVMVDYAWPHFLTHAADFVSQVQVGCVRASHNMSTHLVLCMTAQYYLWGPVHALHCTPCCTAVPCCVSAGACDECSMTKTLWIFWQV